MASYRLYFARNNNFRWKWWNVREINLHCSEKVYIPFYLYLKFNVHEKEFLNFFSHNSLAYSLYIAWNDNALSCSFGIVLPFVAPLILFDDRFATKSFVLQFIFFWDYFTLKWTLNSVNVQKNRKTNQNTKKIDRRIHGGNIIYHFVMLLLEVSRVSVASVIWSLFICYLVVLGLCVIFSL